MRMSPTEQEAAITAYTDGYADMAHRGSFMASNPNRAYALGARIAAGAFYSRR